MPIRSFTDHLSEAFTRQHYEAMAIIIKKAHRAHPSTDANAALNMVVDEMVKVFKADNPNFSPDQFIKATK